MPVKHHAVHHGVGHHRGKSRRSLIIAAFVGIALLIVVFNAVNFMKKGEATGGAGKKTAAADVKKGGSPAATTAKPAAGKDGPAAPTAMPATATTTTKAPQAGDNKQPVATVAAATTTVQRGQIDMPFFNRVLKSEATVEPKVEVEDFDVWSTRVNRAVSPAVAGEAQQGKQTGDAAKKKNLVPVAELEMRHGQIKRHYSRQRRRRDFTDWGAFDEPTGAYLTRYRKYSHEELMELHQFMDITYTWVNGSESNHLYKKMHQKRQNVAQTLHAQCVKARDESPDITPLKQILDEVEKSRGPFTSRRDKESGELRYSFRSQFDNMKWHRGRLTVVCPGHVPNWLDQPANFFRKSRAPNSDERRVVIVHQDVLMPLRDRFTFNTNTIEQVLFNLANLSPLYTHFNDDYFVGQKTTVENFVNELGGPVQLFEGGFIGGATKAHANTKKVWIGSVWNSNAFSIRNIDFPLRDKLKKTPALGGAGGAGGTMRKPLQLEQVKDAIATGAETLVRRFRPRSRDNTRRPRKNAPKTEDTPYFDRYFLKHAPFVFCRNMMQNYLYPRWEQEWAEGGANHLHRNVDDLIPPQIQHAFTFDRPWAGSSKFTGDDVGEGIIELDNEDGCAPALRQSGNPAKSLLVVVHDNVTENKQKLAEIDAGGYTFFALNDGFDSAEAAAQLRGYAEKRFPTASAFEERPKGYTGQKEVEKNFASIMARPLIILADGYNQACVMLRSLALLGLPRHTGRVHVGITDPKPTAAAHSPHGPKCYATLNTTKVFLECMALKTASLHFGVASDIALLAMVAEAEAGASSHHSDETIFIDARVPDSHPIPSFEGVGVVAVGQTLALEDFRAVGARRLELSAAKDAARINWVKGPDEASVLRTFPLPSAKYEKLDDPHGVVVGAFPAVWKAVKVHPHTTTTTAPPTVHHEHDDHHDGSRHDMGADAHHQH